MTGVGCNTTTKPRPAKYAYADPPYLGCCNRYGHDHGDDGRCWDDWQTHANLIDRLVDNYPDGWALSMASTNLPELLHIVPNPRVGAWVKSFASFKPGVNPAYTWEPVVFVGGRRRTDRTEETVRDFIVAPITLRRGLTGAKPTEVARWILDMLGFRDGIDSCDDLFPGTEPIARALANPMLS